MQVMSDRTQEASQPMTAGPILLPGFAVKGVASLGEWVEVGPLRKMNFFVGKNNHGKSTLLKASKSFCLGPHQVGTLNPERKVLGHISETARIHHPNLPWKHFLKAAQAEKLGVITAAEELAFWLNLENGFRFRPEISADEERAWRRVLQLANWAELPQVLLNATGLVPEASPEAVLPEWRMIPAFRQIVEPTGGQIDLEAGAGVIRELQRWQTPDSKEATYARDLLAFQRLTELLQDVLEDDTARFQVPHSLRTIQVVTRQHATPLDIDELGDGIKQVIMIGASALRNSNMVICLEEPEIHLHPGLQKKLIAHLQERTSNQYLVATHSTHILDAPGAAVFHIVHDGSRTRLANVVKVDDLVRVSEDLGYRASDLLQANYVIWVEGPADRLYWRRWLELVDPVLSEGVHYTIISYGGSLLADLSLHGGAIPLAEPGSRLTRSDTLRTDLVDVLKLGRNCTVIADSDKPTREADLRPLIKQLQDETHSQATGRLVVIDDVRTVENLLPPAVLTDAVRTVHKVAGAEFTTTTDRYYGDPFEKLRTVPDKVKIARAAIQLLTSVDQIEVGSHLKALQELAGRIREINGLPPRTAEAV